MSIDKTHIRLYKDLNGVLRQISICDFEEFEEASSFTFASDDLIIVAMVSGKASIFDVIDEDGRAKLKQRMTIRMHDRPITKILSCMELKDIEECAEIYDSLNLDGIVCSLCTDDSMAIFDCFTGVLQYRTSVPIHKFSHNVVFVYQSKIMLALAIDQNIRLFDWPLLERILPSPSDSDDSSKHNSAPKTESEGSKEEEENNQNENAPFQPEIENEIKPEMPSESLEIQKSSSNLLLNNATSSARKEEVIHIADEQEKKVYVPPIKRQKVDLVFENGRPKLKFALNINKRKNDSEFEYDIEEEEEEEEANEEVEIKEDLYLKDIINTPKSVQKANSAKINGENNHEMSEIEKTIFWRIFNRFNC